MLTTTPSRSGTTDLAAQARALRDLGVPATLGYGPRQWQSVVTPLLDLPFVGPAVLVVRPRGAAPGAPGGWPPGTVTALLAAVALRGGTGFTTMTDAELHAFEPVPELTAAAPLPDAPAYVLGGVDPGEATRGVAPVDATPLLLADGRSPLTLEEGVMTLLAYPGWLQERTAWQMLGSRCGDKRVTGIWTSARRARLGWCFAGVRHSWLGMASTRQRLAP